MVGEIICDNCLSVKKESKQYVCSCGKRLCKECSDKNASVYTGEGCCDKCANKTMEEVSKSHSGYGYSKDNEIFSIVVTETYSKTIEVEAYNYNEAVNKVKEMHDKGEIKLESDDSPGVYID